MISLTNQESLRYFLPELALLTGVLALLPLSFVVRKHPARDPVLLAGTLAFLALAEWGVMTLPPDAAGLFGNMVAHDPLGTFFKHIFVLAAAIVVVIASRYREFPGLKMGEFYALLLATTLGMFLMATAADLLMAYLAVELTSLSSYVLTGFKKGDRKSNEGALKYAIYGGAASGVMLFGMSYLYGMTSTTTLVGPQGIGAKMADLSQQLFLQSAFGGKAAAELALLVAVVFVLAGIGYKIASVPFHMWCPDVYEAAYTPFTAFLSVGPKAAGFAFAIRFFYGAFVTTGAGPDGAMVFTIATNFPWPAIIGVLSAATMTLGNLAAIPQTNLKRLLAYSSIAHAGYIMMGLASVNVLGVQSVLFYLVVYLFMNLGAFLIVIAIAQATKSESIFEFRGLRQRAPLMAIAFVIFLIGLTGLPGTAGFIGKFYLFSALIEEGGWYWLLALIGAVNSAVSLYYYMRIARAMFFDAPITTEKVAVPALYNGLALLLVAPVIIFGLYWAPIADWSVSAFHLLGK